MRMNQIRNFLPLVVMTIVSQLASAKGADLFRFENGNTLSQVETSNTSKRYAVYNQNGQKISNEYSQSEGLTRLISGKYTLFQVKSDAFIVGLFTAAKLIVMDQDGREKSIKAGDAVFTSFIEKNEKQIQLTGTKGNVYEVDLLEGKILNKVSISNSTLEIMKSPTGEIILREGMLSVNKIYLLDQNLNILPNAVFDFEKITKASTGMMVGPRSLQVFENGSMAALHASGKILFLTKEGQASVLTGSAKSSKAANESAHNDLLKLVSGQLLYMSDNFNINIVQPDGSLQVFDSGLEEKIQNAMRSGELEQLMKKPEANQIVIENLSKGCLKTYSDSLQELKKQRKMTNILVGATIIINPVVGLGGLLMTQNDFISRWTAEDYAIMTMKILDDAEKNNRSLEIEVIANALMKFAPDRFQSIEAVIEKIRQLNLNQGACMKNDKFSPATPKDLMYRLLDL